MDYPLLAAKCIGPALKKIIAKPVLLPVSLLARQKLRIMLAQATNKSVLGHCLGKYELLVFNEYYMNIV
jgi:hypothetical protein